MRLLIISIILSCILCRCANNPNHHNHDILEYHEHNEHHEQDGHSHDNDKHHENDDGHSSHDHPDVAESYTLYSDHFELFVEFTPFIAGNTSEFTAHYTWLSNFKPLEKGSLTITFLQGGSTTKNTVHSPASPGIFRPELFIKNKTKGKLIFNIDAGGYSESIIINDVNVYEDKGTAAHLPEKESTTNGISYLKEQSWKVEFETQPVRVGSYNEIIKTSGELLPAQKDEYVISAVSQGNFYFTTKNLSPGVYINKGELIGYISGKEFISDNTNKQYTDAKAEFNKAESDFNRAKTLIKDSIIPQEEFLKYKLRYEQTKSAFSLISKSYTGQGIKVIATKPGYIKELYASEGIYTNEGDPIVKITKNESLILRADISLKYAETMKNISSANFKVPGTNKIFNTNDLHGKLISYSGATTGDNMLPIFFEIENSGDLFAGSYVEVWLKTKTIENAITIPLSAILEEQGNYFTYVQIDAEMFEKKNLIIGSTDGAQAQIIDGLAGNERVVTKGAVRVKLSSMSSALPTHGHAH